MLNQRLLIKNLCLSMTQQKLDEEVMARNAATKKSGIEDLYGFRRLQRNLSMTSKRNWIYLSKNFSSQLIICWLCGVSFQGVQTNETPTAAHEVVIIELSRKLVLYWTNV